MLREKRGERRAQLYRCRRPRAGRARRERGGVLAFPIPAAAASCCAALWRPPQRGHDTPASRLPGPKTKPKRQPPQELQIALRGGRRLGPSGAVALAAARLPALSALHTNGDDVLLVLRAAPWAASLRDLKLDNDSDGSGGFVLQDQFVMDGPAALARLAASAAAGGLASLSLRGARVGQAGAAALAAGDLSSLRRLELGGNYALGEAGVIALADAPWIGGLTYLGLSDCGIDDAAAEALAALPLGSLRALDLSRARGASPRALRGLAAAPWAPRLAGLDLSGSRGVGADPQAWRELSAAPLRALLVLGLADAGLCGRGALELAAAEWLGGLRRLHLGDASYEVLWALRAVPSVAAGGSGTGSGGLLHVVSCCSERSSDWDDL